jgi:site-specific DNA recombinase
LPPSITSELDRLNASREGDYERLTGELDRVERQIRAVIDAIKDGLRTPGMKEELLALEARKRVLAAEVKLAPAPQPRPAQIQSQITVVRVMPKRGA